MPAMRKTSLPILLLALCASGCAPPLLDESFANDLRPFGACSDIDFIMSTGDDSVALIVKGKAGLLGKLRDETPSMTWDLSGNDHPVVFLEHGEKVSAGWCGGDDSPESIYRRYHATVGTLSASVDEAGNTLTLLGKGLVLAQEHGDHVLDPIDFEQEFDVSALR